MKHETLFSIGMFVLVLGIIVLVTYVVLQSMGESMLNYEKSCSSYYIDNETKQCNCPCAEPTWCQKKGLCPRDTCDGWVVQKGEPCFKGDVLG